MKVQELHSWQLSPTQAQKLQLELANRVSRENETNEPRLIAGVDISKPNSAGIGRAATVVLSYPGLQLMEVAVAEDKLPFPYIPGLLSFRESPLVLAACQKLSQTPDLILVDGQGIAHPRRFGIASHLGLILDTPTIGCAKSRLCGTHAEPGPERGAHTWLFDESEVMGAVLRTVTGVKPLYISAGHKISLEQAIYWTLECGRGYRLPEPTRQAHIAANSRAVAV